MPTKEQQTFNLRRRFGGNATEKELKAGRFRKSLLRQSVGGQLTEKEGAALRRLDAQFNKSPEGNKRVARKKKRTASKRSR